MSKEIICSRPYVFPIECLKQEKVLLRGNHNALTKRGSKIEGIRSTIHSLTEENPEVSPTRRNDIKDDIRNRCYELGIDLKILPDFIKRYEEIIGMATNGVYKSQAVELTTIGVLVK